MKKPHCYDSDVTVTCRGAPKIYKLKKKKQHGSPPRRSAVPGPRAAPTRQDDPPPSYIVWPQQWHADVIVADDGFWPFVQVCCLIFIFYFFWVGLLKRLLLLKAAITISGKGTVFYGATEQIASYFLVQTDIGRKVHEVVTREGGLCRRRYLGMLFGRLPRGLLSLPAPFRVPAGLSGEAEIPVHRMGILPSRGYLF